MATTCSPAPTLPSWPSSAPVCRPGRICGRSARSRRLTEVPIAGRDAAQASEFAAPATGPGGRTYRSALTGVQIPTCGPAAEAVGRRARMVTANESAQTRAAPRMAGSGHPHQRGRGVSAGPARARRRDGAAAGFFADSRESVRGESGDFLLALAEGAIGPDPGRNSARSSSAPRRAGLTTKRSPCSSRSASRSRTWRPRRWPTARPPSQVAGPGWSSERLNLVGPEPEPGRPRRTGSHPWKRSPAMDIPRTPGYRALAVGTAAGPCSSAPSPWASAAAPPNLTSYGGRWREPRPGGRATDRRLVPVGQDHRHRDRHRNGHAGPASCCRWAYRPAPPRSALPCSRPT